MPNADADVDSDLPPVTNPDVSQRRARNLNVAISNSGLNVGTKICDPTRGGDRASGVSSGLQLNDEAHSRTRDNDKVARTCSKR